MSKTENSNMLAELLEPISTSLNEEAARKLLRLRANPKLQARIAQLARKCNEGKMTSEERAQYETFVIAGDIIAILQARARLLLGRLERSV
jgi:hypothetical protein